MLNRVLFANFAEDGMAVEHLIDDGVSVEQFLEQRGVSLDEGSFRTSVNNQICTPKQVLVDGDKVRVTPRKMAGA